MNLKPLLSAVATVLVAFQAFAQVPINSTDSTAVICGQGGFTLTDSGSNGGNYGPNENDTIVICSQGGNSVTVYVDTDLGNTWDVHQSDHLYFYDGIGTNNPLLGDFNTANSPGGFQIASTLDNPTGCITAVFVTNGANEGAGFDAVVECVLQWQPYTVSISANPQALPTDTGYIDICPGQSVVFTANCQFPYNQAGNGGYLQTLANCSYKWVMGDGTTFEGVGQSTVTYTFDQMAGYNIYLTVTDPQGQIMYSFTKVRVATHPNFTGTYIENDTLCLGQSTLIHGAAAPVEGTFLSGGTFGQQLYLPDGNGQSYQTEITIIGFPNGQTIQSATDLSQVCVNMEHSYLGDLQIALTCPSGQTVILKQYPGGGGTYLGSPNDIQNGIPGVGADYCFSMSAIWGTILQENTLGNWVTAGTPPGNSMTPGTYLPVGDFTSFIGCPINGDWTITITDNLSIDDGYIFEWSLFFDSSINPNIETYTPQIISADWATHPSIISSSNGVIGVKPTSTGNFTYDLTVTDNHGCTYDTTVTITVVTPYSIGGPLTTCNGTTDQLIAINTRTGGTWTFLGPTGGTATFTPDATVADPDVAVDVRGDYQFLYYDNFCTDTDTISVKFLDDPSLTVGTDTICLGDTYTFTAQHSGLTSFVWSTSNTDTLTAITVTPDMPTDNGSPYQYTINGFGPCGDRTATAELTVTSCIVPNVFNTGSNLEPNSYFQIPFLNISTYAGNVVKIYDRWGFHVYEAENYQNKPWDGLNKSDGVYYYVILLPNNEVMHGYVHKFSGVN